MVWVAWAVWAKNKYSTNLLFISVFQELKNVRSKTVVIMHDFFIDRIVRLNDFNFNSLISEVSAKMQVGGGSIREIAQDEIKGGNAVNIAYALAKLGAKISLITIADSWGNNILKKTFAPFANKKLLITSGRQGYTVSLDRKSTRLNSSHIQKSRMPSSA